MLALPSTSRMAALLRSPFLSSSTTTSSSSPAPTLGIRLSAVPTSSSSSAFSSVITAAALPCVSRSALFSSVGFLSASSSGSRLLAFSSGSVPATRGASMGTRASTAATTPTAKSVHEFTVTDINGEEVELSKFKGKVLLIVNVASACGLTTGNYTELAEVYSRLRESGLEILAFPCNQFGGQESGTNEQIKQFACTKFKAEYPIFNKIDVNGPKTAPLYEFLKASKGGGILGDSIKWNFAKFLVNQDGIVIDRYAPTTSPKKIEADIKKLLGV